VQAVAAEQRAVAGAQLDDRERGFDIGPDAERLQDRERIRTRLDEGVSDEQPARRSVGRRPWW